MKQEDKKQFLELMERISEYYGASKPTVNSMSIYYEALSNSSYDAVKTAIDRHIRDVEKGRWMPRVSDIVYQIDKKISSESYR